MMNNKTVAASTIRSSNRNVQLVALMLCALFAHSRAEATPVAWTLQGAILTDGQTLAGRYTFDADTNIVSLVNIQNSGSGVTYPITTFNSAPPNCCNSFGLFLDDGTPAVNEPVLFLCKFGSLCRRLGDRKSGAAACCRLVVAFRARCPGRHGSAASRRTDLTASRQNGWTSRRLRSGLLGFPPRTATATPPTSGRIGRYSWRATMTPRGQHDHPRDQESNPRTESQQQNK
jgi:hypothetical protein